jgi:hypothetical protein
MSVIWGISSVGRTQRVNLRPPAVGLVAGTLVAMVAVESSLAAVQRATLSLEAARPGDHVTLHVEATARFAGTDAGFLILVPEGALERAAEATHCEDIDGATALGEMTWQAAMVEFAGVSYPGFVGDAQFTVPQVPDGAYNLAESIEATGTGCHVFASFTVTTSPLGDTAMEPPGAPITPTVVAAALVALAIGALRRVSRPR